MKFYHYTPEFGMEQIIKSGIIKLATSSFAPKFQKPVAWVSTNPHFEQTALKDIYDKTGSITQLTFEQQAHMFGCARFEIKPTYKLYNWTKLAKRARIRVDMVRGLEEVGRKMGANPNEWYGSLKPIPIEQWIRLEQYVNGKWVEVYNFETNKQSNLEGLGEGYETKLINSQYQPIRGE